MFNCSYQIQLFIIIGETSSKLLIHTVNSIKSQKQLLDCKTIRPNFSVDRMPQCTLSRLFFLVSLISGLQNGNCGINSENTGPKMFKLHHAEENSIAVNWTSANGKRLLTGQLGLSLPTSVGTALDCVPDGGADECHQFGDFATLQITERDSCFRLEWKSTFAKRLEDCFDLAEGDHWYGGGETYFQRWPIENEARPEAPYVNADFLSGPEYGSLVENYWLISTGVSIRVDETVPLFMSWRSVRENKVCFVAQNAAPYYNRVDLSLAYDICIGDNVRDVHLKSFEDNYLPKPSGLPDEVMLRLPVWSTWAQYRASVNQSIVIDFARRIKSEGFVSSHLEIDDRWESCYGDATFDPEKFPNPKAMVDEVKAQGLRVTLWTHPFINLRCERFLNGVESQYFVKTQKGQAGIAHWWAGEYAGAVDFTNPEAVEWWKASLELLRNDIGIDSFKFDAGEVDWLPSAAQLSGENSLQPSIYTTAYVEACASFGGMIEVRSGKRNQNLPVFTRIMDRDGKWGYDNGLKSVIPTVLQFGIVGYPFVLPDMVGGNTHKPPRELYIRWIQANAFLTAVQISIHPWDYDDEVVQIVKDVLALREEYIDHLFAAANQALLDGSPIIRPVWWVDPSDSETFDIDTQYMLGDNLLVAPVLEPGEVSRDIYLPKGNWRSADGAEFEGPVWLRGYAAELNVLPFFLKRTV